MELPSSEDDDFVPKKRSSCLKTVGPSPSLEVVRYTCKLCPQSYTLRKNLLRHIASKHDTGKSFQCSKCQGEFKRRDVLTVHLKSCGQSKQKNKNAKCSYPGCDIVLHKKTALIDHLKKVHEAKIEEPVSKKFNSIEDFVKWKDSEEVRTFSYFSLSAGSRSEENPYSYFYCQKDGGSRAHRKLHEPARKTCRKRKVGQVKNDQLCISMMKVKRNDDKSLSLTYYPSHSHPLDRRDYRFHPPTHETSNSINDQIVLGVPVSVILRSLQPASVQREKREEICSVNSRDEVISKALIKQRCCKQRNRKRLHKEDATSTFLMVQNLVKEKYNPVVLYKPVGMDVVVGPADINLLPNAEELFLLGIQTEAQKDLMIEGCKVILVVDDTHNCTQYENFKLLNSMVVDSMRRGWSVAHLITNRIDQETVKYFFQVLKERCEGKLHVNAVITDDAPALINGIELGMEESVKHLLCQWHVQETFRRNLRSLAPAHLFSTMFDKVLLIVYIENETDFLDMFGGFCKKYAGVAPLFVDYFKECKVRAEKWAKCYRTQLPHGNVNTTGHAESLHNKIKTDYMKRVPNKRVDDCVNILLQMEEDDFAARKRQALLGFSESPTALYGRHVNGLAFPDSSLRQESNNIWWIKSGSNKKMEYMIHKVQDQCDSDLCFERCTELACPSLCGHLYNCTCPDSCPICKHVHKLHSFLNRGHVFVQEDEVKHDCQFFVQEDTVIDVSKTSLLSQDKSYVQLALNLKKLQGIVEARSLPPHALVTLDTNIDEALRKAVVTLSLVDLPTTSMPASRSIAPKEKLATQESQLLPFKRKKKRKPEGHQRLGFEDKEALKEDLISHLKLEEVDSPETPSHHVPQSDESTFSVPSMPPVPTVEDNLPTNSETSYFPQLPSNFTPKFSNHDHLYDFILSFDYHKLNLLHLKSLEGQLHPEEEQACQKFDKLFRVGWLYSGIIDVFLRILADTVTSKVFIIESDVSLSIMKGNKVSKLMDRVTSQKEILICPVNFNRVHWCLVIIQTNIIKFYDPLQQPLKGKCQTYISNLISIMKTVKPHLTGWKIETVSLPPQTDAINCGAHVCWLAYQTINNENCKYVPLSDPLEFRRLMYDIIISGCKNIHEEL